MIPALLSWSGGKDAAWALHALRLRGEVEVVGLLTTLTEGFDRVSMQGIRRDVLATPDGSDHGNIRALQTHGLAGVRFSQQALQRNA